MDLSPLVRQTPLSFPNPSWQLIPILVAVLFASNIAIRRVSEMLQSERFDALVVLNLEATLIRQLQKAGIETVDDITPMNVRQLKQTRYLEENETFKK